MLLLLLRVDGCKLQVVHGYLDNTNRRQVEIVFRAEFSFHHPPRIEGVVALFFFWESSKPEGWGDGKKIGYLPARQVFVISCELQ